jgi:hypothetical protein
MSLTLTALAAFALADSLTFAPSHRESAPPTAASHLDPSPSDPGEFFEIDVHATLSGTVRCVLPLREAFLEFELEPATLRSPDFQLLTTNQNELTRGLLAPPSCIYRGTVLGMPGSRVDASIHEGRLTAIFDDGGSKVWLVEPACESVPGLLGSTHVVHRLKAGTFARPWSHAGGPSTRVCNEADYYVCPIAVDTDSNFYDNEDGGNPENDIDGNSAAAVIFVERHILAMSYIYERYAQIRLELTAIRLRTTDGDDPYNSGANCHGSTTLLTDMANEWSVTNAPHEDVPRAVVQAFLGCAGTMNGSSLDDACDLSARSQVYVFRAIPFFVPPNPPPAPHEPTFRERVHCLCHELGHNFNGEHADGGIMAACYENNANDWTITDALLDRIIDLRNDHCSCFPNRMIAEDPEVPGVAFADSFTTTGALDNDDWIFNYRNRAIVNTDGVSEPSGTASLDLSYTAASATDPFTLQEVRTRPIRLRNASAGTLKYKREIRGTEGGEILRVEYLSGDNYWKQSYAIFPNDAQNQTSYSQVTHTLPCDAFHDGARMRFRSEVDDTGDHIFIDDVEVNITSAHSMQLTTDILISDVTAVVTVTGGTPYGMTALYASDDGMVSTSLPGYGVYVCLENPTQLEDGVQADGSGTATWTIGLPDDAEMQPYWLQAVQSGNTSNVIVTYIGGPD